MIHSLTPCTCSCSGHIASLELLLKTKANIDLQDAGTRAIASFPLLVVSLLLLSLAEGLTMCMHAAFSGNTDLVRMISATCNPDLSLRSKAGQTTLGMAKTEDIQHIFGSINGPRLVAAAGSGDVTEIRRLLEQETWLDYQDAERKTALIAAAQMSQAAAVKLLLEQQSKPCPRLYLQDSTGFTGASH